MKPASSATSEFVQAPPYPEGWFQVAYADDVAPGQVIPLHYFGRELVMFRTASGVVQVLDAFCAHLGAHLGVGGKVVGESIRCPFHGWAYGVDGKCQLIPYSTHVPKGAAVKEWPTAERSGLVMMWHSPVDNPPLWEAPELAEYGDPAWTKYLVRQRYVIRSTVQEIVENVPDTAHFQFIHGNAQGTAAPNGKFTFDAHKMAAEFQLNLPATGAEAKHNVTLHGLGLAANLSVSRGTKSFWTSYTPIDRDTVEVHFSMIAAVSTPKDPSGEISRDSVYVTLREFEKDIPIWEHKTYRPNPLVIPADGPIARFRTWVRQFYPESAQEQSAADTRRVRVDAPVAVRTPTSAA